MKKHISNSFQFILMNTLTHTHTQSITQRLWLVYQTQNTVHAQFAEAVFALLLTLHDLAKMLIWKEAKDCICIVHCSSQPKLVFISYDLSSIKGCWQVPCSGCSSLLSGQVFVQVHLDVVNGFAQVVTRVGAHVVSVHTQHCWTGLVHQGRCLLAQATAQIREDRLFKEISVTKRFVS